MQNQYLLLWFFFQYTILDFWNKTWYSEDASILVFWYFTLDVLVSVLSPNKLVCSKISFIVFLFVFPLREYYSLFLGKLF